MVIKMNKKVLFISTMYPTLEKPYASVFVHETAIALKKQGYNIDVVVPIPSYNRIKYPREIVRDGIKIIYLKYFKFPKTSLFSGYNLYLSINNKLDLNNYFIIHAHTSVPDGIASAMLSRKYNIPFVIHVHTLDVFFQTSIKEYFSKKYLKYNVKKVYMLAKKVICVSKKVEENICKELNVDTTVIYNGVNTERFYPKLKLSDIDDKFVIISVGNLVDLKGHKYLIEAFSIIKRETDKDVTLIIIGQGENEIKLKKLVNELELDKYIKFYGALKYDQVAIEMRNANLFVLPSYYEALGCVYLEAMASGLPTIGTKGCGIDEIIVDKDNGILVEPKSSFDIAAKILNVINDDNLRNKISNLAFSTINNNYTWDNAAQGIIKEYKKSIK